MNTAIPTNNFTALPPWPSSGSKVATSPAIPQPNADFYFSLDGVGLLIVVLLLAGLTLAVLLGALDRLHALCRQALSLIEVNRRESVAPPTTIIVRKPTETANTLPAEAASTGGQPAAPPTASLTENLPIESPQPRTFRVQLAAGLIPKICGYVREFLARHGADNEAGGMLVGTYDHDKNTGATCFTITGFIEAGPRADFSPGSIQFDSEFQAQQLTALQLESPLINLGCGHRHPGDLDTCSSGDFITDREAVEASQTRALIFAIITLNNPRQLPGSLRHGEFKFDFYLMAEETAYEYQAIQTEIIALPLTEVKPELAALVALRGPEVRYDFALLKQLPDLTSLTVQTAATGVILTAKFATAPEIFRVWIKSDGALHLIQDQEGNGRQEFPGPWTQGAVGAHVWLSHLFLQAYRQISANAAAGYQRHYGLLDDKNRLVAEVRAMQLAYGNRAVLRRNGNELYWEYTVHQSGRAFPIRVIYPDTYPTYPPSIMSVLPLPSSPHRLGGQELCWLDVYSSRSDWNPARGTAVIAVHAAHRWFACLLVYLTKGEWPKGADHGDHL